MVVDILYWMAVGYLNTNVGCYIEKSGRCDKKTVLWRSCLLVILVKLVESYQIYCGKATCEPLVGQATCVPFVDT